VVEAAGEALRAGAYRPLNLPRPVEVTEDSSGQPTAIKGRRRQAIASIDDRWRLDDEWWRERPVTRLYYAVRLATGPRRVLYKDLTDGRWYEQDY
jgi:hypothetical protein